MWLLISFPFSRERKQISLSLWMEGLEVKIRIQVSFLDMLKLSPDVLDILGWKRDFFFLFEHILNDWELPASKDIRPPSLKIWTLIAFKGFQFLSPNVFPVLETLIFAYSSPKSVSTYFHPSTPLQKNARDWMGTRETLREALTGFRNSPKTGVSDYRGKLIFFKTAISEQGVKENQQPALPKFLSQCCQKCS